jgi:hypothetical protein
MLCSFGQYITCKCKGWYWLLVEAKRHLQWSLGGNAAWEEANRRDRLSSFCMFTVKYSTVSSDFSVSLHTYILIVYNIYIFFVSIYIKSLHSNARPDQGKSALVCTLIGLGPTNSRQKCTLKDVICAELKRYIWLTDLIYKHQKGHWNRRSLYSSAERNHSFSTLSRCRDLLFRDTLQYSAADPKSSDRPLSSVPMITVGYIGRAMQQSVGKCYC